MSDPLDPRLRKIKIQIDNYYRSNGLMKMNYGNAAWWLLSLAESNFILPRIKLWQEGKKTPSRMLYAITKNYFDSLGPSMRWLLSSCNPGGRVSIKFNYDNFRESDNLLELGRKYCDFETTFI